MRKQLPPQSSRHSHLPPAGGTVPSGSRVQSRPPRSTQSDAPEALGDGYAAVVMTARESEAAIRRSSWWAASRAPGSPLPTKSLAGTLTSVNAGPSASSHCPRK
eukprot:8926432-Heterocapsa_arctica.AAC.1